MHDDMTHGSPKRTKAEIDLLTERIIGAAIKVHQALGPGLLESTYEACMQFELTMQGVFVERQRPQPVAYDGLDIDVGFRIDLLVEREVVVELKAVSAVLAVHEAQIITYLKLAKRRVGLLLNFNVVKMVDGVRRFANGLGPS